MADFCEKVWSGREDSNLRPLPPEDEAPAGMRRFSVPSALAGVLSGDAESPSVLHIQGQEVQTVPPAPVLETGYVYFIQAGERGPIKIGMAENVMRRLAQLQTANGAELQLIGSIPGGPTLEREWHRRFAHIRLRGEWFKADPALFGAIALAFVEAAASFPCPLDDAEVEFWTRFWGDDFLTDPCWHHMMLEG